MKRLFRQFLVQISGATAVEYAMIAGLFAVAILGWGRVAGENITDKFTVASDTMDDAVDLGVDTPVTVRGGD